MYERASTYGEDHINMEERGYEALESKKQDLETDPSSYLRHHWHSLRGVTNSHLLDLQVYSSTQSAVKSSEIPESDALKPESRELL